MSAHPSTLLSVNVNKIATLRNSRGGQEPSVLRAANTALAAGAGGITVHPRPDLRHIRPDDVLALAELCRSASASNPSAKVEFNIEGNPFAPANAQYPGLMALIEAAMPTQATLVPDSDAQLTSDHGFDLARDAQQLAPLVAQLRSLGVRVSVFVDDQCSNAGLAAASAIGIERIEIYTGPFAAEHASGSMAGLSRCADLSLRAAALGIGVNAGHDLSQDNLFDLLSAAPAISEVSIGHALFCEALYAGLSSTVSGYLAIIRRAQQAAG